MRFIKKVAQERGFFEPETEKLLNTQVEIPGGDAIDKILASQPLTLEEQVDLAIHIGTMLRRTPATVSGRRRSARTSSLA